MRVAKKDLHRLVDELPDEEVPSARRFLEYLQRQHDPLVRALLEAPIDDEPQTVKEKRAVARARGEAARGKLIPWRVARRRLSDLADG